MSHLHLVWRNLWRKPMRTGLTLASVITAFVLFAVLAAVRVAFSAGVDVTGADRLITIHKVSIIQPLPIAYMGRIQAVEGVDAVTHASWFGGSYQEKQNSFPQFPVDPDSYLEMFPEFELPEEKIAAWKADRTAAVVGRTTAEQYGLEIGQRVPIIGSPWQRADGAGSWEFNLVGIYDGAEKGTDTTQFLFHYEYFNEARAFGEDLVGWYTVRIAEPERAAEIAEQVDKLFANSPAETRTTTEEAFAQSFADQIGSIGTIVTAIVSAVLFLILLVAGNTMAQSVRERINELAVLKTLGFTDGKVLLMVLAESLFVALLGGVLGLALGWFLVQGMAGAVARFLPIFFLPDEQLLVGLGLALLLGLAAGLLPAIQAMRLPIANALRRA